MARKLKKDFAQTMHDVVEQTIAKSEADEAHVEGVILWGDTEPTTLITLTRSDYPLRSVTPATEAPAPTSTSPSSR